MSFSRWIPRAAALVVTGALSPTAPSLRISSVARLSVVLAIILGGCRTASRDATHPQGSAQSPTPASVEPSAQVQQRVEPDTGSTAIPSADSDEVVAYVRERAGATNEIALPDPLRASLVNPGSHLVGAAISRDAMLDMLEAVVRADEQAMEKLWSQGRMVSIACGTHVLVTHHVDKFRKATVLDGEHSGSTFYFPRDCIALETPGADTLHSRPATIRTDPRRDRILGYADVATFRAFQSVSAEGPDDPTQAFLNAGRIAEIGDALHVSILESAGRLHRVRIESGTRTGEVWWLARDLIDEEANPLTDDRRLAGERERKVAARDELAPTPYRLYAIGLSLRFPAEWTTKAGATANTLVRAVDPDKRSRVAVLTVSAQPIRPFDPWTTTVREMQASLDRSLGPGVAVVSNLRKVKVAGMRSLRYESETNAVGMRLNSIAWVFFHEGQLVRIEGSTTGGVADLRRLSGLFQRCVESASLE